MPVANQDKIRFHNRTVEWRALQTKSMNETGKFLTLQELADHVGMTKQAVRYFCRQRGIPYSGFGKFGYFPTPEEIRAADERNEFSTMRTAAE